MKYLRRNELASVSGGLVESGVLYGTAVGVGLFALGALVTIATAGVAAPAIVALGLGALGTVANATAIVAAE